MSKARVLVSGGGKTQAGVWQEPERAPSLRGPGLYLGPSDCPGGHEPLSIPDLERQEKVWNLLWGWVVQKPPQRRELEPREPREQSH